MQNLVVKAGSFGLGTFTKPTQSLPRHAFLGGKSFRILHLLIVLLIQPRRAIRTEYVAEMLPMISAAQGWERYVFLGPSRPHLPF